MIAENWIPIDGYGIIYSAFNKKSKKMYVGQTIQKLSIRINHHHSKAKRVNNDGYFLYTYKFINALRKYKQDDWEWKIICECSNDMLDEKEEYYINLYNTQSFGYNVTMGGSAPMRGKKFSTDHKKKISESKMGDKNPMKKKFFTEEDRKKVSEQFRGDKNSNTKLNKQAVIEIRKKYEEGNISIKDLAKQYAVSPPAIRYIIQRINWKWVD